MSWPLKSFYSHAVGTHDQKYLLIKDKSFDKHLVLIQISSIFKLKPHISIFFGQNDE